MATEPVTLSYTALGTPCTLTGEILKKWQSLGGQDGLLGYPVEEEVLHRGDIRSMQFQKGSIYAHPTRGAFYLTGKIYRYWADQLGVYGPYGFPAGDPVDEKDQANRRIAMCQEFTRGRLSETQPEIIDQTDLRGEIARRGIDVRTQGKRGTCSVQTMVFLMEYLYTGLLGKSFRHLSVEYANHAANLAENLKNDGQFFSSIAAGYQQYGIVKECVWPYNKDWTYDYGQACSLASEDMQCLGCRMLADGLRLSGRFIKPIGAAGLNDAEFDEILSLLDDGIPVGIGRDHSMAAVGYRRDTGQPGGGIVIFRNSHGTGTYFTGYQTESFEQVRNTVLDAYVFSLASDHGLR